jgi:hypothetical protein
MCAFVCDVCDEDVADNNMHVFKDPFKALTELWACASCVKSLGEQAINEHVRNTRPCQVHPQVLGIDLVPVTVRRSCGVLEHDWGICKDRPVILFPKLRQISINLVDKTLKLQKSVPLRNLVLINPRFERIELDFSDDADLREEHQLAWRSQVVDSKFFTRRLVLLLLKMPRDLVREMLEYMIK